VLRRDRILPEDHLPAADGLITAGRDLAGRVHVAPCPFLTEYGVDCEATYKRARMGEGAVMLHAQVGYRDAEKSRRAYAEIHARLAQDGIRLDRYGICLDWSMGYPADRRPHMPRGTGLILDSAQAFAELSACAPVAPHFGDFVIGTPAALENTIAALGAGATSIGNLGQYFTFRQPHWDDDVTTTAETVKAIALIAAQPEEILVHSNLDDGFAATFRDAACALGAVLIERYIVEDLLGAHVSHCYGHTYSDPLLRLAFQRALAATRSCPGTMVYGNTTLYGKDQASNYAALASYLLVDIYAQRSLPSGHAVNPVPVTEAERIPEVDEIVDAQRFAGRLLERSAPLDALTDGAKADGQAQQLLHGGRQFRDNVLEGLSTAGIDTSNAFELLLSLRRTGARELETQFGPGELRDTPRGPVREQLVTSATLSDLESKGRALAAELDHEQRAVIESAAFTACLATTDVHEYGKVVVENLLANLGVALVDAGISIDPEVLAQKARAAGADFIAISTYNGVALEFIHRLQRSLADAGMTVPIFIGGKLNQVPDASNTSLPVDVSAELRRAGAIPCHQIADMLSSLATLARETSGAGTV
jgi:methylmalonyl-CoA mutase cobalamin-binding subunit